MFVMFAGLLILFPILVMPKTRSEASMEEQFVDDALGSNYQLGSQHEVTAALAQDEGVRAVAKIAATSVAIAVISRVIVVVVDVAGNFPFWFLQELASRR